MNSFLRLCLSPFLPVTSPPPQKLAMDGTVPSRLLELPSETVYQIFSHLPPLSLVDLSETCHFLRSHTDNDLLWARFVQENLPVHQSQPSPCVTWKSLYISHYPYWFLPRQKVWFSDKAHIGTDMAGQLAISRYDHRRGCIEAYRLVAEHGTHKIEDWEWRRNVLIHTFDPKVRLWLDDPVVKLDIGAYKAGNRLQNEQMMRNGTANGIGAIFSTIFLARGIPASLQDRSMHLWPPRAVPTTQRVRNESGSKFRGESHRPRKFAEISDTAFRIRKWMEFGGTGQWIEFGGVGPRMGEDVMTFSTLPMECYTPTKEKPFQGIWVGDYAGHGCEFLALIQKHESEPREPRMPRHPSSLERTFLKSDAQGTATTVLSEHDPIECSGRLEAVKLTGDPNVPRGEYTWIAEDIGRQGLIRIAEEQMFKGARVVESWGHIAANNFTNGKVYSMSIWYTT